jgi:hemoglobin
MSVYERIGGAPAVNAAVDRFYERVLADPMLAPFFKNVSMQRLKAHQFAFLSQALGGPQEYSGAAIARAHVGMRIEQHHFDAVTVHLAETLRELGIGEDIISEVAAAVAPLAGEIVNAPKAAIV